MSALSPNTIVHFYNLVLTLDLPQNTRDNALEVRGLEIYINVQEIAANLHN